MKIRFTHRALMLFMLVLIFLPLMVAHAAAPAQVTPPPDVGTFIQALLAIFVGLIGWPAALGAALALLMKFVPAVTATVASWISFVLNAVMFLVVAYLVFTGQSALVAAIDSAFGGLAKLLADILIVVGGFGVALHQTSYHARAIAAHTSNFREARLLYTKGIR